MDAMNKVIKNISNRPYVHAHVSVEHSVICMVAMLLVQILMLVLTKSYSALGVIGAALSGVLLANVVVRLLHRSFYFHLSTILLQGILVGMLTPSSYSKFGIFFITFAVMFVVKLSFNGFADSWVNPVVAAVALAWIFGIADFPSYLVSRTDLYSGSPSIMLIQNGTFPVMPLDAPVTAFLNDTVFSLFGISIPEGYVSLFWDSHSVIPAFRFNFICLLSSIVLISFNITAPVIPGCYIATYALLVLFGEPFVMHMPGRGDVLLALLTSGTLFCTLFVLQWYGTTPVTMWGKICYGVIGGMMAFLIIGCGTSPVGSVFTVLLLNIISLFIQHGEYMLAKSKMHRLLSVTAEFRRNTNA